MVGADLDLGQEPQHDELHAEHEQEDRNDQQRIPVHPDMFDEFLKEGERRDDYA